MHGYFESFERKCPYGCSKSFVKLVFLQPPATKSRKTRNADLMARDLADSYKMRDIPKPEEGVSAMTKLGRTGAGTQWLDIPHAKPGGAPAKFDIKSLGADPGAFAQFKPGMFPGPTPHYLNRDTK